MPTAATVSLVVFRLDDAFYAVPLAVVDRVVLAVEIRVLPGAPEPVLGAIDVEGEVLPVLDVRRRFLMPARDVRLADHFLIARALRRAVVLPVDEVRGVVECDANAVTALQEMVPRLEQFPGVVNLSGDLTLIHDLDRFLALDEVEAMERAVEGAS